MRKISIALTALSALALVGCSRTTREVVYTPAPAPAVVQGAGTPAVIVVDRAPPAPRVEAPPPPTSPGTVWVPGYWSWNGSQYDWTAGHWETARSGYTWVPHRWEMVNGRWQLMGGTWVRQ
jgi:hypothetical protein